MGGSLCLLLHAELFVWLKLKVCVHCHTLWVHVCICTVVCRKQFLWRHLLPLALTAFLHRPLGSKVKSVITDTPLGPSPPSLLLSACCPLVDFYAIVLLCSFGILIVVAVGFPAGPWPVYAYILSSCSSVRNGLNPVEQALNPKLKKTPGH